MIVTKKRPETRPQPPSEFDEEGFDNPEHDETFHSETRMKRSKMKRLARVRWKSLKKETTHAVNHSKTILAYMYMYACMIVHM